jgi:glycosyltransferase involved in cell wall biosynthesis
MHKDLIVFGEDWHGLPSSTQHLVRYLAQSRKVIWVNSIGLRQPTFSLNDVKRVWKKLIAKPVATIPAKHHSDEDSVIHSDNFITVNPLTIPAPQSKFARYIASKLLVMQLIPIIQNAKLHRPILWTSLPTAVDVAGQLNESALVYYCGDDFSGLAGVDHQTVAKREQTLLQKADLVMASSELLVQRFPLHKTQLLAHGVDYSLFSNKVQKANDLPNDGRHIAGFYGSISNWLDLELLHNTIKKMPEWHFVFIGNAVVDVSQLTCFDNVTLLGERPHHLLPSYCQHWTASLLPFVDNAQIRACNPLKLSEYLATGKAIIATSFPAIDAYRGLVQIANSSDAMVEALRASVYVNQLPAFSRTLQKQVVNNNWAVKAQQVSRWLAAL